MRPIARQESEAPIVCAPAGERGLYLGHKRLLVRAAWGGWMVAPGDNLDVLPGLVRDGIIEPATTRLVRELLRPGQVYVNGGANFGYYAVLAASVVGAGGRVIAVEANPYIVPFLAMTRYWSGFVDRIEIFHRALWDISGETARFAFDPQMSGGGRALATFDEPKPVSDRAPDSALWSATTIASLSDARGEIPPTAQSLVAFEATTARLDDIVAAHLPVDLIHLDIETAEPLALQGARAIIIRSPWLRLIVEWSAESYQTGSVRLRAAFETVWRDLSAAGWRVRHVNPDLAGDGGLFVSGTLDFAVHGNYVWLRPEHDPWG